MASGPSRTLIWLLTALVAACSAQSPTPTATSTAEPPAGSAQPSTSGERTLGPIPSFAGPTPSPTAPGGTTTAQPTLPEGPLAEALRAQLDQVLAQLREQRRIPAMAAEIVFPDGSRWSSAGGLADVDRQLPATVDTPFVVGSITKTFVTAAVMELQEEGRLSIDDPLSEWVPDYPDARNITLAMLLSHTSGIFDYFQHAEYNLRVFNEPDHAWTAQEILDDFWRKPYCEPGACYQYSNTNFVLLGLVVERETEQELGEVLRERFFEPLDLEATYGQCEEPPPPGSARGYLVRPERAVGLDDGTDYRPTKAAATVACAAGDIVSTASDLADWARAVYGGDFLEPESVALMTDYEYSPYSGGEYGMGTRTRVYEGQRMFGHTGSLRGFSAAMWHFPEVDLTIVVLTNRGRIDANPLIDALAAVALPLAVLR